MGALLDKIGEVGSVVFCCGCTGKMPSGLFFFIIGLIGGKVRLGLEKALFAAAVRGLPQQGQNLITISQSSQYRPSPVNPAPFEPCEWPCKWPCGRVLSQTPLSFLAQFSSSKLRLLTPAMPFIAASINFNSTAVSSGVLFTPTKHKLP